MEITIKQNMRYGVQMEQSHQIELIQFRLILKQILIYTDSTYVKNGITKWIHAWKNKNWKTANKKPVKNKKLWQQLDEAIKQHDVTWEWVKGHSGHPQNEKADELANKAIEKN